MRMDDGGLPVVFRTKEAVSMLNVMIGVSGWKAAPSRVREKRRSDRRRRAKGTNCFRAAIYISHGGEMRWVEVKTRDLSRGGLGFVTEEKLTPGNRFFVYVGAAGAKRLYSARCVHVTELGRTKYRVGCAFEEIMASDTDSLELSDKSWAGMETETGAGTHSPTTRQIPAFWSAGVRTVTQLRRMDGGGLN
jgi:hypothetical protein